MKSIPRLVLAAALLSSALAVSGCLALAAGAAAGAGTYAYVQGEMNTTFEAPLDRVWAATQAAMNDLEFPIGERSKDALAGELRANQADGTPVRVRLNRVTDNTTEARVRVGMFGDEQVSRAVLERIRDNL
jgi:enolase